MKYENKKDKDGVITNPFVREAAKLFNLEELNKTMKESNEKMETLNTWLLRFTIAIFALTAVLVAIGALQYLPD